MIKISPLGSLIAYLCAGCFTLSGGATLISYSPFDWLSAVSSSARLINLGFAVSLLCLAVYVFFSSAIFEAYLTEMRPQGTQHTLQWWALTGIGLVRRLLVANLWLSIVLFPTHYGAFLVALYGTVLLSHRLLHWPANATPCGSDGTLWRSDTWQVLLIMLFILFVQASATAPAIDGQEHVHFIEFVRIIGFLETNYYLQILLVVSILYMLACALINKRSCLVSLEFYVALLVAVIVGGTFYLIGELPQYTGRVLDARLGNAFPYWQFSISTGNFAFVAAVILIAYFLFAADSVRRLFKEHAAINVLLLPSR